MHYEEAGYWSKEKRTMNDDRLDAARARIARGKGRLAGWRTLQTGEAAVLALEVLGDVRAHPDEIGMRVVVAGRDAAALEKLGRGVAEDALRRRAVLGPDDVLVVEAYGPIHTPEGGVDEAEVRDDVLRWPWRTLTFHVPVAYLPAIAGLVSDAVRGD